jgi:hypothetical protein
VRAGEGRHGGADGASSIERAPIASADVPQAATRLGRIRTTVAVLAKGASTTEQIADRAPIARRHALYQLAAARALGWAIRRARRHEITARGRALLATVPGSAAERAEFVDAVRSSPLVAALAEGIDPRARGAEAEIAARIEELARPRLASETARERARTIAAWLRLAASPQGALPAAW